MPLSIASPMALLYDSKELTSAAATLAFSGIPGGFTDLRALIMGRGDNASTSITANITFNSDSGSNYDREFLRGTQTTASAGEAFAATSISVISIPSANAPAGEAGFAEVLIPSYAGTTFQKALFCVNSHRIGTTASASNLIVTVFEGFWRSTSAITSITFTPSAGNFAAGSRLRVFGIL